MTLEEIRIYLPKYLSLGTQKNLFDNLRHFPDSFNMYQENFGAILLQGDGIVLEENNLKVVLLSNTCDMDTDNKRYFQSQIVYSPLISVNKYKNALLEKGQKKEVIENHIKTIKEQKVTQIFYLPKGSYSDSDSFIFLDRISHTPASSIKKDRITGIKLFSLSQTAFYIFLFKLSIHFTRMQESVDRDVNPL